MSSATHHLPAVVHVRRPAITAKRLGLAYVVVFLLAFAWAQHGNHEELSFWALSGLFPIWTPAALSISVGMTVAGIGSWSVVALEFIGTAFGLAAIAAAMAHVEEW